MAALNLSSRIRFVNDDGTLTPEAYRSLQEIVNRTGGVLGSAGGDTFVTNDYSSVEANQSTGGDITGDVFGGNEAQALGEMLTQVASADSLSEMVMQPAMTEANVAFRAFQSTAQAVAAVTFTKVLFQSEDFDAGNNFASSTFTAPSAGIYLFTFVVATDPAADLDRRIGTFYKNSVENSRVFDVGASGTGSYTLGGSTLMKLATGDTVDVYIYIGAAKNTIISSLQTHFTGYKLP
jgi:hypothetical protein